MRKITFISSFILKICAMLFMTFDHVGLFLRMVYQSDLNIMQLSEAFRIIGRLALPLYIFLIVEGVLHTKSFGKYMLRLGILASVMTIPFMVIEYGDILSYIGSIQRAGNIYIDLILVALAVYCLKHPKPWVKVLTLLPLGFSVLSFVVKGIEFSNSMSIYWFPSFITMQYDFLSVLLGFAFFFAYALADIYVAHVGFGDKSVWEANGNYRLLVNIIMIILSTIVHIFFYLFIYMWPDGVFWDYNIQLAALISGAFILFYSGRRGYNALWFRIVSYIYYPLHLAIIAAIFLIINGGL